MLIGVYGMSSELFNQFKVAKKEVPDCKFKLPGSGEDIYFTPFTTKDQKSLLKTMEKDDNDLIQEAFDSLLRKCVVNDGFNPYSLYPKDREALLINLRNESVTEEYTHAWTCRNEIDEDGKVCGAKNETRLSLSNLDMKPLEVKDFKKEISLDSKPNFVLLMDMTNRGDEKEILSYTRKNSKGMKDLSKAELLYATMASFIKGLKCGDQEEMDFKFEQKIDIIESLSLNDRNKIQKYITELNEYGYDMTIPDCSCKTCGHTEDKNVDWIYFFAL